MGNTNKPEGQQQQEGSGTSTIANDEFWSVSYSSFSTALESLDLSGVSSGLENGVEFLSQTFDQIAKDFEGLVNQPAPAKFDGPIPWGGMLPHPVASKKLHRFGDKNFRVGLATMHGWRPTMEDAHCVSLSLKNHLNTAFFAIFDGHGGSRASQFVSEHLLGKIEALEDVFDQDALVRVCVELDQELLDSFDKNEANVGTTCIFSIIRKEEDHYHALFGNIGDSRIVWGKKKSNGFKAVAVTEDHSPNLPSEQERIEKAGGRVFISRVDGMLAVSRAFGDIWFKMPVASAAADRKVSVVPEFQVHDLAFDDLVLMACDGIYEAEIFTRESVIDWVTSKMSTFQDVAVIGGLLLNECLSRGSRDNMSCMLITFKDGIEFAKNPMDYIPGPWFDPQHEGDWGTLKFQQVYEEDAKASGYSLDQAVKLRGQMEKQRNMMMNANKPNLNANATSNNSNTNASNANSK